MRDKLKGAVLGALVALGATVLLAQTPPWTAPRTWTTGDLLTASQFNAQFRDNLLNLRDVRGVCGFRHHRHGQRRRRSCSVIAEWKEICQRRRWSRWIWDDSSRPRASQFVSRWDLPQPFRLQPPEHTQSGLYVNGWYR